VEILDISNKLKSTIADIENSDILFRLVIKHFRTRPCRQFLLIAVFHIVIWLSVGLISETVYPENKIIWVSSISEMTFGGFLFGIFIPTIWAYYAWLPRGVLRLAGELCSKRIIPFHGVSEEKDHDERDLLDILESAMTFRFLPTIAVIGIGIALLVFFKVSSPFESTSSEGIVSFWFVDWWTKVIIACLFLVNAYVILLFALKAASVAISIGRYFKAREILHLYLLHPDKSGGMGSIGKLAFNISYFAVLIGFWATWLILLPLLRSGDPDFYTAITLYPAYIAFAIIIMVSTIYPAHQAMKKYKLSKLEWLGYEIERRISSRSLNLYANLDKRDELDEEIKHLKEFYELTSAIREWPVSIPALTRFSGISIIPALSGILSFFLDIAKIFPKQ
jgi:hypothetical protein